MKFGLWLGAREGELYPGASCPGGCDALPELQDRFVARVWLQQFRRDAVKMAAIRELLRRDLLWQQPWRLTDDSLIEQVAALLNTGFLHAHVVRPTIIPDTGARDVAAPAATKPPPPREREEPEAPQEANSLSQDADERAIAEALKSASANGMPFCEECMKARQQRDREAAVNG